MSGRSRARLYADEQVPFRVTDLLRKKGYDVLKVQETNESKYGDGRSDEEVLHYATQDQRAVLTFNRRDFRALAQKVPFHCGIICCETVTPDEYPQLVDRIDAEIRHLSAAEMTSRLVNVPSAAMAEAAKREAAKTLRKRRR